jgi:hypothetical protein
MFAVFLTTATTLMTMQATHAFFTDTATSANNTLTAADVFPGSVVINEIMWSGSSKSNADEWIELRNTTNSTIDISNWVLENAGDGTPNITIPSNKSIPANGFFLISNNDEASSIISISPDLQTSSVELLDSGEQLILKSASGNVIDTANVPPGWFAGVNGNPDKSMERNSTPGNGTILANWHTATTQANLDSGAVELATPNAPNSL